MFQLLQNMSSKTATYHTIDLKKTVTYHTIDLLTIVVKLALLHDYLPISLQ